MSKMLIFSAPSGSGKTTIVKYLLEIMPELMFSISATNRSPRANEWHAKDYYFMSTEEFKNKIKTEDFVEWEEVYEGTFYGTLSSEVERIWSIGKNVIFDVDVKGGLSIKKKYKENALAIFIMPPSIEELERRLRSRGANDEDDLRERIDKAKYEMSFANDFDKIIINDDLQLAKKEAIKIVTDFLTSE
ncbi:guanylate kinase [Odoribacter sp. OttesenSCG-928-L07]|nr:guanylate kinase [Odoribacter sp. OttesenSCG-928-L07]MDL2239472.1 guanylate kinase [Bacteroidales bacterium OttesenSCG-928-L14]MDL2240691.1 guanylate kinase [Bacteroidales bacterium OttesenSCG-928-K22]